MTNAVIFNRASKDISGRAKSVSDQNTENHAVCSRNGWNVIAVFTENNIGASKYSKKNRAEYKKMIDFLQTRDDIDVLVCWEGSRKDRTLKGHVELSGILQDSDIKLCLGGRVLDLNDDDDEFTAGLDALLSVREIARLRKRSLRGLKSNAVEGKPHGKPPWGYMRVGKLTWAPNEGVASVLEDMFSRIYNGQSGASVVRYLNTTMVPLPGWGIPFVWKEWSYTQVKQILLNPAYISKRVYRGEIIGDGTWPALIKPEIYWTVVAKLTDDSRKTHREGGVAHLCSGQVVSCDSCKGRLRKHTVKGIVYYVCADKECTSIKYDTLNDEVEQHVLTRLEDPSHWSQVLAGALNRDAEVQEARSELARLKNELREAMDLWRAKKLSVSAYAVMESDLQAQIDRAEKVINAGINPLLVEANNGPSVRAVWDRWTIEQRRQVVMALYSIKLLKKNGTAKRIIFTPK